MENCTLQMQFRQNNIFCSMKSENHICVTGGTQKNTPTAIVPAKEQIDR